MKKIAVFASGSGTNAENIAKHFANSDLARVTLVLTDVRDAGVVGRMKSLGIDTFYVPGKEWRINPVLIADFLEKEGIDLVVLAGFMRKVDDLIVARYRNRMLNIHPSLLPAYGGKGMYGHHVHEAVVAAGEKESGVTVHHVSEVMDGGEIVAQQSVALEEGETPESLEAKIHPIEYQLYPKAIEKVLRAEDEIQEQAMAEAESEVEESAAQEWATALGMEYSEPSTPPEYTTTPPPVPEQQHIPLTDTGELSDTEHDRKMPSTYLIWSVLCLILCCTLTGIVATIFSCQVSSRFYSGNYEGAEKASRQAEIWIIISFCLGVLQATVFSPLYMLMF